MTSFFVMKFEAALSRMQTQEMFFASPTNLFSDRWTTLSNCKTPNGNRSEQAIMMLIEMHFLCRVWPESREPDSLGSNWSAGSLARQQCRATKTKRPRLPALLVVATS